MRYNPCGRVVDFGRRSYSTACRFLSDDDTISQIRWVEARPDAPVLGRVTCIMSLDDETDPWLPTAVGEVEGAPRPFTGQAAPVGLNGDHVCGTDSDFEHGGTFDDVTPEVQYGALGFPLCCDPPRRVRGGAGASGRALYALIGRRSMRGGSGASGRAVVSHTSGPRLYGGAGGSGHPTVSIAEMPRLYGGAGGGGRIEITPREYVEPLLGGLELGGPVGEVYTPGSPVPGTSCATAAGIDLAGHYVYTMHSGNDFWFQINCVAGQTYNLKRVAFAVPLSMFTYYGGTCFLLTPLTMTPMGPTCLQFTALTNDTLRLNFNCTFGTAVLDFTFDSGPC